MIRPKRERKREKKERHDTRGERYYNDGMVAFLSGREKESGRRREREREGKIKEEISSVETINR